MVSNESLDLKTLLVQYSKQELIPYERLLQTKEWIKKRSEILKRDQHVCTKCKRRSTKHFTAQEIQEMFKIPSGKTEWFRVGTDLRLPDRINDSHYWFFSIETLNKFRSSYWNLKYLKFKKGSTVFVLIKSSNKYFLHIHHKLYIINKLPWEYVNSDLETICNWCHWELHKKEKVRCYKLLMEDCSQPR